MLSDFFYILSQTVKNESAQTTTVSTGTPMGRCDGSDMINPVSPPFQLQPNVSSFSDDKSKNANSNTEKITMTVIRELTVVQV